MDIVPIGSLTRLASSFKTDVMNTLASKKKALFVKFEIFTEDKLIDCLSNGCRILQINCQSSKNEELIVEGEYARAERLSFERIRSEFDNRQSLMNVSTMQSSQVKTQHQQSKLLDVLILAVKNCKKTADFFSSLKIPHIITFEFTSQEFDYRHKLYEDTCIDSFAVAFYRELIELKPLYKAFQNAYEETMRYLSRAYFDGKGIDYVKKIIGQGPILLPEGQEHH